ncbi:MAG: class I SAM-dependent methyltransferase [Patescibacteria group bacterium]|nr:class I SAM-dependent methyltransferase [Patescibacteria group bacterium]
MKKPPNTSWGEFAEWYHTLLEYDADSYQRAVILPNLLRLLDLQPGDTVLDVACGQGFFTRQFWQAGANVIGTDIAPELIALAKKNIPRATGRPAITFQVAPANNLAFAKEKSVDKATVILAIQNIEDIDGTLRECRRVLKPGGGLYLVLNHPAFRIPKGSAWGYDENAKVQYRRMDRYLSEARIKIQMHPGDDPQQHTVTFHRPLQLYFKSLTRHGFCVRRLEEWISHRKSQTGPRAAAEDRARKEIPLFLALEAIVR